MSHGPEWKRITHKARQCRAPTSAGSFPWGNARGGSKLAPTEVRTLKSALEPRPADKMGADQHLPIINGVGVLEKVEEGSEARVLHVEG